MVQHDEAEADTGPAGDDRHLARRGPRAFREVTLGRPSTAGLVVGAVFWLASLGPTLLPRAWMFQAAISALSFLVGYGLGVLGALIVRATLRRLGRDGPTTSARTRARRVLVVAAPILVAVGLALWQGSQSDQRDLVAMPKLSPVAIVPMLLLTVALVAVILGIGRCISYVVSRIDAALLRHVPGWIAHTVTVVLVVVVGWTVSTDYVADGFLRWANTSFGTFDDTTAEGVTRPTGVTVSGGPGTLTPWDTLGYEGRNFAAGATPTEDLAEFAGAGADPVEPVRVYVGLQTAETTEERAQLAVRELERTGGFDREVLVVWTVTGTGWVDPVAARSLELMWAGDTAIVATQYSYFPSWISFLVDKDEAARDGEALNDAVYERWSTLPPDDRPRLVAFGLSLGSFGSEAAFLEDDVAASIDGVTERTDGVLWMGPTNSNSIWNQVERSRGSSPAWQPVIDDGEVMRYMPRLEELDRSEPWDPPRMLYIGHPSDPVTWWDVPTLWRPPPWMDEPVGFDVPDRTQWFPLVTWIATVGDLIAGFSTPPGHGHNYTSSYTDGWAIVVPPPGWSAEDTARLEKELDVG